MKKLFLILILLFAVRAGAQPFVWTAIPTINGILLGNGSNPIAWLPANTVDSGKILMNGGTNAPSWITASSQLPGVVKFILATQDTTTSQTNVNATGFSFPIAANEKWQYEINLLDSGILFFGINAPSGCIVAAAQQPSHNAITTIDGTTPSLTNQPTMIFGTAVNGSTAGTIQLRWQTSTSAVIRIGSYLKATKMN